MCGRYSYWDTHTLGNIYDCEVTFSVESHYNVVPSTYVPVIVNEIHAKSVQKTTNSSSHTYAKRTLVAMYWGLIPEWAKSDTHKGFINARSETITEKPSFKENFKLRRCIVPARGFYEWSTSTKHPYFITLDNTHMAFAGLWDGGSSAIHPSVAIITRASDKLQSIHHRIPVVLETKKSIETWFNPLSKQHELLNSIAQSNDSRFIAYKVDKRVNNPKTNDASLLDSC